MKMKNPNPLMLLRIAQADAYCMATEYIRFPRDNAIKAAAKKFEKYVKHPTHRLAPGMYTDDTQMSIANAELLLSGKPATKLNFANHFMEAFARDKREGYSRGFQSILEQSKTGQDLLDKLIPDSTKNGAAMRAVPLGVIPSVEELIEVAKVQASVTHDTVQGRWTSIAIALMSHLALYSDMPMTKAVDEALLFINMPWSRKMMESDWQGEVKNNSSQGGFDVGLNTVWAVSTLLKRESNLIKMLDKTIEWGGDTDSVAAIAWGIASCRMHEELPEFFEKDLEVGMSYGSTFLRNLGTQLMEKFDVVQSPT